mgnify:CR=1 FL=1
MNLKNKTADLLYRQMLIANEIEVSKATLAILDLIQPLKVHNQLLGLACAIICLLEAYDLSHSDVLGVAHNIVHSQSNNIADNNFKAVKRYMKSEWNIALEG